MVVDQPWTVADFDSAMRRFESSRPSQAFQQVSGSGPFAFRLLAYFRSHRSLGALHKLTPLSSS